MTGRSDSVNSEESRVMPAPLLIARTRTLKRRLGGGEVARAKRAVERGVRGVARAERGLERGWRGVWRGRESMGRCQVASP